MKSEHNILSLFDKKRAKPSINQSVDTVDLH